jgi:hypothetical protein
LENCFRRPAANERGRIATPIASTSNSPETDPSSLPYNFDCNFYHRIPNPAIGFIEPASNASATNRAEPWMVATAARFW